MPPRRHTGPRGLLTPSRRPHKAQGTGHTPTAATRGAGDWPLSHSGLTWPRGPATQPRRPHGAQGILYAFLAAILGLVTPHGGHTGPRGPTTPSRRPNGAQGTNHAFTATMWKPNVDPWRPSGLGNRPRPHGGNTKPRGSATPPGQPHGAQGTGHAFTAATLAHWTSHTFAEATRGTGKRPHLHGGQTEPREPPMPSRIPHGAQGTGHAPTAATRCPGDRPHPHGGH